ncbi:MAG: HAD family hydrolase [Treponema sp.]|jgi:HAD superfamily hydrolase (TIGR01549 family)|nr:HAD family hydrolase [Treponema sp.]
MIKNIFLDAGGVILDETEFQETSSKIITNIIKNNNINYSIKNYWNDIEEAVYRFVPKVYDFILYKNISNLNDFDKFKTQYKYELKQSNIKYKLMDGIQDFLKLFSKQYRIGILGQYGKDFRQYLEEVNLLQYFTFSEIQDDYKTTKPDTRYFEAILKKCKCEHGESVMVGDRIDKDIIPAKMIGMKTIRVKVGIHKNQEPRTPDEIPDLTVKRLEEIKTMGIIRNEIGKLI